MYIVDRYANSKTNTKSYESLSGDFIFEATFKVDEDSIDLGNESCVLTREGSMGIFVYNYNDEYFIKVLSVVKERMIFLQDFWEQASFFFEQPVDYDLNAVKPKWADAKTEFFLELIKTYEAISGSEYWEALNLETVFKTLAEEKDIKPGELMLPFRVMLVGGKFGPGVFDIALLIGKKETISRIQKALIAFTED